MQNLTKENFFNEMKEKYPLAMKDFCNWIDKYKVQNNWDMLFNGGLQITEHVETRAPKFHDLPFAMQIGIMAQYFNSIQEEPLSDDQAVKGLREDAEEEFKTLDHKLYIKKYPQYANSKT